MPAVDHAGDGGLDLVADRGVLRREIDLGDDGGLHMSRDVTRSADNVLIESDGFLDHQIHAEARLRGSVPRLGESAREPRVGQKPQDAAGEGPGIPGGTRRPLVPSSTISGVPPARVATTGSPVASASRIELQNPS